jgi:hypothetical protein
VQSLEALARGGIVPVQVTETVWPMVEGTVMLSEGGVDAQASIASKTPTEQSMKARKTRGWKTPDSGADFFFMMISHVGLQRFGSGNAIFVLVRFHTEP